jgi:hypothetical protein
MEKKKADESPIMKQFKELKEKRPDALLLFRSGDFYEAYEQDALDVVKILGTALSKSRAAGNAYDMVGFPHYALDAYLPKLVRAGKRVAICDQINLTPDPSPKGEGSDNNDNSINNSNSEDKTMKTNETIESKRSAQSDACQNKNVQDAQVNNQVTTEADVAEVNDIMPKVTPSSKATTVPLSDHGTMVIGGVPRAKKEAEKPQTSALAPQASTSPQTSYRVVLVPAKDGGEWPKLYGFASEQAAAGMVEKMAKSIRNSWDRDERNEKRFYIKGGKKYCVVFQQLCDALNKGDQAAIDKACKASVAVYEGAVADGKAEREERKAQREAEKTAKNKPSAARPEPQKEYSKEDVAAMLRKVLAGGDVPKDIEKLLKAA